ncbi:MAG: DUF2703 domain-containing protein [Maribacter sp.]|nr:DUF2703 domain-containing protein [Maribacter sp.]
MNTKSVQIDFLYLDNEVCNRCRQTEKQLEVALESIGELLQTAGYNFTLNRVKMDTREKATEYKFTKSPTIRVNNIDIGFEQMESQCTDCGSLCGCEGGTTCRIWQSEGQEHEVPPKALLIDRVLRVIYENKTEQKQDYRFPDNLENFYSGIETKRKDQCC